MSGPVLSSGFVVDLAHSAQGNGSDTACLSTFGMLVRIWRNCPHLAWLSAFGVCRVMAFCFTFILDEDLSASSERDWETFISF